MKNYYKDHKRKNHFIKFRDNNGSHLLSIEDSQLNKRELSNSSINSLKRIIDKVKPQIHEFSQNDIKILTNLLDNFFTNIDLDIEKDSDYFEFLEDFGDWGDLWEGVLFVIFLKSKFLTK